MKIDRIPKLLFPLYSAELECNDFELEAETHFGIEYEWHECSRCGSKAVYVRKAIATKSLDQLEEFEPMVDLELVCAECGSVSCGYIMSQKFSTWLDERQKKIVATK